MARILILIGAHISTAPRPQKEADALSQLGHEVEVVGVWSDPELIARDEKLIRNRSWKFMPALDFRPAEWSRRLFTRARHRIAVESERRLGIIFPEALGYGVRETLRYALNCRADLTIVHSEPGLWIGKQLIGHGRRVGVDFEDWFSEDLLPDTRSAKSRAVLKELELLHCKQCRYCLAPSVALAEALAKAYQRNRPTVVYNAFPISAGIDHSSAGRDRRNLTLPSLLWYSNHIGRGRGLETLFGALSLIKAPVELHLRGRCAEGVRAWAEAQIPFQWRSRVFFHQTVPCWELPSKICEHDIGLALEPVTPQNKNLTVSNKIFQYLAGGLAVIATKTAGQLEILSQCKDAALLVESGDRAGLANAIEELAADPRRLKAAKESSIESAREKFCWERQIDNLKEAATAALEQKS